MIFLFDVFFFSLPVMVNKVVYISRVRFRVSRVRVRLGLGLGLLGLGLLGLWLGLVGLGNSGPHWVYVDSSI